MLISLVTGNCTFQNGSMRIFGFYARNASHLNNPQPLLHAHKTKENMLSLHSLHQLNASQVHRENGSWSEVTYDAPDSSFFLLQITRQQRSTAARRVTGHTFNFGVDDVHLLLRAREYAALRSITIEAIDNPEATKRELNILGRFDIIEPEEFEELGFEPDDELLFEREVRDTFIKTRIIEPEVEKVVKPKLVTQVKTSGGTVRVVSNPKRKIIIK